MKKSSKSGLYILSEIQCLNPASGAYHHVQNGLKELKKYYDIDLFILNKKKVPSPAISTEGAIPKTKKTRSFPLKSTIKWFYLLIARNWDFIIWYFRVKKKRPAFIYERAAHLDFKGLLISKLLGVPHFYEINWAFYLEHFSDYPKLLNTISRLLETAAYNNSDHCFFIGGISESFTLKRNNYSNVQNGIEKSFVELIENKRAIEIPNGRINIVFVGHAMKHHRLDLLVTAFEKIAGPEHFHIHFVGNNYEIFDLKFPPLVKVTFHGQLNHESIASLLSTCQVGILPYAVPFSSAVKLFMYGAAYLLLVIPNAKNLKKIFSEDEALFFKNEDDNDLAKTLDSILLNPSIIKIKGKNVHDLIVSRYLWEQIFLEQARLMDNHIK